VIAVTKGRAVSATGTHTLDTTYGR
jgi:hypothetical protein